MPSILLWKYETILRIADLCISGLWEKDRTKEREREREMRSIRRNEVGTNRCSKVSPGYWTLKEQHQYVGRENLISKKNAHGLQRRVKQAMPLDKIS